MLTFEVIERCSMALKTRVFVRSEVVRLQSRGRDWALCSCFSTPQLKFLVGSGLLYESIMFFTIAASDFNLSSRQL